MRFKSALLGILVCGLNFAIGAWVGMRTERMSTPKCSENLILAPKGWSGLPPQSKPTMVVYPIDKTKPQPNSFAVGTPEPRDWPHGFSFPSDAGNQFAKRDKSKVLRIPITDVMIDRKVGEMVFDAQ